jgi:pimeloyl-ACP methyl ester carboxylesterase
MLIAVILPMLVVQAAGMSTVAPWTVEAARSPRIALLREDRDFVILDPRGHGLSEPRTCPELDGAQPFLG